MKFENILYWCEFPSRADWKELNSLFVSNGMKAKCYLCVESVEEFRHWKAQLRHYKGIDVVGAWPSIPLDKGYWFSGFVEEKEIDKLGQYKWMNLKIDIEPPFKYFKMLNVVNALLWVLIHPFKRAKNNLYLREKLVETIKKNELIISTFPLPEFILRRYGFFRNPRFEYSFMFYSSMIPFVFRPLYRIYYRWFMGRALRRSKDTYFAVGLISKGIFNSEPQYSNAKQLTSDLKFLLRNKAKNLVVYSIGGITERKNPEEWVKAIKEFI
jgi:glycosyltransferase involved in cell wall biosynthesis